MTQEANRKPQVDSKLHNFYLGTSSWTFADWRNVFYPHSLPASDQLAFYATQFNSVEVNTSFYALPAQSTVLQWVKSVPDGFTLALKAPRVITHERRLVDCQQETLAYLDVLRFLGPAAAPGFLQFPPQFTRARYGKRLADYLDWLAGRLDGVRVAVEVRAQDLMTEAFARFLAERGLGLVVVERTGAPDLFEPWRAQLGLESAPAFLYIRLIGNDGQKLPNDREIQRPQDELLDKWAERIAVLLEEGVDVFAYIHNPFEGHSPESVRRLWTRVNGRIPLPVWSPDPGFSQGEQDSGQLSIF